MAVNYFAGFNPEGLDANKALVSSLGQGIQFQQAEAEAALRTQQAAEKQQAIAQEELRRTFVQDMFANPSPEKYSQFAIMFPEQSEAAKRAWDLKSEASKTDELGFYGRLYPTLQSGNPVLSKKLIDTRLNALKNSGGDPEEIDVLQTYSDALGSDDPAMQAAAAKEAQAHTGTYLALINKDTATGLSTYNKDVRDQELQPATLQKLQGEAEIAETDADYRKQEKEAALEKNDAEVNQIKTSTDNSKEITDATVRNTDSQIADRAFQQTKKTFVTGGDGKNYVFSPDGTIAQALNADGTQIGTVKKLSDAANLKMVELTATNDSANIALGKLRKALDLNKTAYDGAYANERAAFMNNIPFLQGTKESFDTTEYNNLVTGQALESLKATFGAAPTEGERAMLLKLQASSEYPAPVRKRILEEAISTIESKVKSNDRQIKMVIGSAKPVAATSAVPVTGKAYSRGQVTAWAKSRGIDPNTAIRQIINSGGQVN